MAMVHGAIFDAVNAIDRRYEPYLGAPPAKRWFSKDAAAAAAAYRVLVSGAVVRPDQQAALEDVRQAALRRGDRAIEAGPARDGGVAVGEAAGWAMIAARTGDGRFGDPSASPSARGASPVSGGRRRRASTTPTPG